MIHFALQLVPIFFTQTLTAVVADLCQGVVAELPEVRAAAHVKLRQAGAAGG
jgi:hypothetical protein